MAGGSGDGGLRWWCKGGAKVGCLATRKEQTKASFQHKFGDVHTRLMKKNYDPVPQWWFYTLLVVVIGLTMLTCEGFGRQLQLPYWGVLLTMALAFVFTLPIDVITATTNQVYYIHGRP
ncbi:hypothetical protein HYC85_017567 [Camellia sinensis]|uniref:Uncharacterized protein n=1 Tax=Camellia sinensis TaxID=4442 RepID=A0A7J7GS13_CAMSI|nr:hypothetical protein HYC85_017567 [Camellia sinensis]